MKNILLVFGTRPEAVKMAPLCHALRACPEDFRVRICVTAQHRRMLDQVLRVFDIVPDVDLNIMRPEQDLFDVTANVLTAMRDTLAAEKPDITLVHGDTTTALASALASFYAGIPVGHVEAGLRTHDPRAPFPEEINRQFVGRLAALHFAPTARSAENLRREGVAPDTILVTGNTVVDALQWVIRRLDADPARAAAVRESLKREIGFSPEERPYVLITGHRRENFGDGFDRITAAVRELAVSRPALRFVYPVHLNPNVLAPVRRTLSDVDNVHLIAPQDYEPFVTLLRHALLVLTDSGGIQEEAPSLGKPVLVMRDATERPEAVEAGTVRLVGADRSRIVAGVSALLDDPRLYQTMARAHNPYGDGRACERIVAGLRGMLA